MKKDEDITKIAIEAGKEAFSFVVTSGKMEVAKEVLGFIKVKRQMADDTPASEPSIVAYSDREGVADAAPQQEQEVEVGA